MSEEMVLRDPHEIMRLSKDEKHEIIESAVRTILVHDERLSSDPEVIEALRDYVKAEMACQVAFDKIVSGDGESTDERLFRGMLNMKNTLRDEIWGGVRGLKPKEEQMKKAHEIIVEAQTRVLEAKKEIDPLA